MASKILIAALSMIATASPVAASSPDMVPMNPAPAGTPDTRYCMHLELTGSLVEPLRCWTRDQWAAQGVDVDEVWAKEGVRVIG